MSQVISAAMVDDNPDVTPAPTDLKLSA